MKLHRWGFSNFDTIKIAELNVPFAELDVWLGKSDKVKVHTDIDIYKTIKKARKKDLKVVIEYDGPIKAPILKNQEVGTLKIFFKNDLVDELKVYSSEEISKVNLFSRLFKSINYLIWGDV